MITRSEIDAALERLNPSVAATNAVGEAFGNKEAVPLMRDIAALADVDYDSLMQTGMETLTGAFETDRESPRDHAEGFIHGFIVGALAQQEADRG